MYTLRQTSPLNEQIIAFFLFLFLSSVTQLLQHFVYIVCKVDLSNALFSLVFKQSISCGLM